jgi:hypothetical protein
MNTMSLQITTVIIAHFLFSYALNPHQSPFAFSGHSSSLVARNTSAINPQLIMFNRCQALMPLLLPKAMATQPLSL